MSEALRLVDPTSEKAPALRPRCPPPTDLRGKTVGLLDISKARGDVFLDRIAERLNGEDVTVQRYTKPTNVRAAPEAMIQTIVRECDVVLEALSD